MLQSEICDRRTAAGLFLMFLAQSVSGDHDFQNETGSEVFLAECPENEVMEQGRTVKWWCGRKYVEVAVDDEQQNQREISG